MTIRELFQAVTDADLPMDSETNVDKVEVNRGSFVKLEIKTDSDGRIGDEVADDISDAVNQVLRRHRK